MSRSKRSLLVLSITGLAIFGASTISAQKKGKLEIVATFMKERPGNIAISPEGRLFITMGDPAASTYAVKEILLSGSIQDFPDTSWTAKPQQHSTKGINHTIGIQVSSDNILWVLDIGTNKTEPKQGAKLIGWDINSRQLRHIYYLPDAVMHPSSFVQDFVIDEKHHTAIIADMSLGGLIYPAVPALIVIDLNTGNTRRILENDKSFQPEDEDLVVNGRPLSHTYPDGKITNPRYPLNPISIDPEMNWIYYGALGGKSIHRISAENIANELLTDTELAVKIEYYAEKPKSDGFKIDDKGQVYLTDVENNAIGISTPNGYTILAQDNELLSWPDGLAIGRNGYLYIVSNQLQNKPWWNNGRDDSKPPYYVLRIKIK